MTEYWSKQHHDNGVKHKQALESYHKEKREKTLHGARSEHELKQQLRDIEKAAKDAIAVDRNEFDGQFYSSSQRTSRPPPPPPITSNREGSNDFNAQYTPSDTGIGSELREDTTGVYEIRGQTYLEGRFHADKLSEGVYCEIYIEEEEEWIPARVLMRREVSVPHTQLVLKTYDVAYSQPEAFTDKPVRRVQEGVKADRLRLLSTKDGTVIDPTLSVQTSNEYGDNVEKNEGNSSSSAGPRVRSLLDQDSGRGMWETVSVELVNEAARAAENERTREEMREGARVAGEREKAADMARLVAASEGVSVMSVVDPYGTGMYRGVYVGIQDSLAGGSDQMEIPALSLAQGVDVGFKKRKRPSGSNKISRGVTQNRPPDTISNDEGGLSVDGGEIEVKLNYEK